MVTMDIIDTTLSNKCNLDFIHHTAQQADDIFGRDSWQLLGLLVIVSHRRRPVNAKDKQTVIFFFEYRKVKQEQFNLPNVRMYNWSS